MTQSMERTYRLLRQGDERIGPCVGKNRKVARFPGKRHQFDFTVNHIKRCGVPLALQALVYTVQFCSMPYMSVCRGAIRSPTAWTFAHPSRGAHGLFFRPSPFSSCLCLIRPFLMHVSCIYLPCIRASQNPFGCLCGAGRGMFRSLSRHQRTRTRTTTTRAGGTRLMRTATPHLFLLGLEDMTLD